MANSETYHIIGGGLAGTILALTCLEQNVPFLLINRTDPKCSSRVAAGMWNPVTFKKCNLSWETVAQVDKLQQFYSYWQSTLQANFYHPLPSKKLVPNAEYYNNWSVRSSAKPYNQFLGNISSVNPNEYPTLRSKESAMVAEVHDAGYVDAPTFLDAAHAFLHGRGLYKEEQFDVKSDTANAQKIIFAEGFALKNNPYFNYLPLNGTHGDILTIQTNVKSESIFNFGKFLLPLGNGTFRYGSTYNWEIKQSDVSMEGRSELVDHWAKHFDVPFEIVEQKAGIRPTVKDRLPLVGKHPEHSNMYCFNGLGTKGVMIAPWLAENFVKSLEGKEELNQEVNIDRFASLWKK